MSDPSTSVAPLRPTVTETRGGVVSINGAYYGWSGPLVEVTQTVEGANA